MSPCHGPVSPPIGRGHGGRIRSPTLLTTVNTHTFPACVSECALCVRVGHGEEGVAQHKSMPFHACQPFFAFSPFLLHFYL